MRKRTIELKKIKRVDPFNQNPVLDEVGRETFFNYREQLWILLRLVPEGGSLDTSELMSRAAIQSLLEQAQDEGTLYLDDQQYELLKKVLDTTKWVVADSNTAKMIDDIRSAPESEI